MLPSAVAGLYRSRPPLRARNLIERPYKSWQFKVPLLPANRRDRSLYACRSDVILSMTGMKQDQLSRQWDEFRSLRFPPDFIRREPEGECMAMTDTMLAGCVSVG